jgi:hypothetical protein
MINGSANLIGTEQRLLLEQYLKNPGGVVLPGNKFTILKHDLMGTLQLIEKQKAQETEHDHLVLAQDFIEYSQLESAVEVLEQGVNTDSARTDLQEKLLELYRLTDNEASFRLTYKSLLGNKRALVSGWKTLERHFDNPSK